MCKIQSNKNRSSLKLTVFLLAFSFIFSPLSYILAQTTTYPSKYFNIDSNGKVTKHIFANGVEIATIEGIGSDAEVKYLHTDNLGSTNVITDENGVIVETTDYLPFGSIRVDQKTASFPEQRKYIGQEYDTDTKLNYLNARYYDSTVGKFISQDPQFWNFDKSWLADPQNQNSYSYARNNPINLSDPSGLLTVIIPGTSYKKENWSRSGAAKDFISSVEKSFKETPRILFWSGKNNKDARKDAANFLTSFIGDYKFADGEKLNIIGHSHGGNIGILASQNTDRKIDTLVTLGTPVRNDYQPNYDKIGTHINAYSNIDAIQAAGGQAFGLKMIGIGPILGLTSYGFVPASRKFNGAENVGVTKEAGLGPRSAHFNLWKNSSVWSIIDSLINK